MNVYAAYKVSLGLTIFLTLLAAASLLPLFGLLALRTFAPLSTLGLLLLAGVNCAYRAEVLKKRMLLE